MIRINLLPEAKRQTTTGGGAQLWVVIYVLAAVGWSVALLLVYLNFSEQLEDQKTKNGELQVQIDRAKRGNENIKEIEEALEKSRKLEEVVTRLQSARQGPARMLVELSRLLSEGGGPTVDPERLQELRKENPLGLFNPGWDVRRLWLTSFQEDAGNCTMLGRGKTNEDVAEFLRRLNVSELFEEIMLESTAAARDEASGLSVVEFSMSCKVKY
ncbi:MAG: PilN domain-containing protein [Myxococcales bacterium]|nr:PilN domain-containing protein [Myxococcales bacterium]